MPDFPENRFMTDREALSALVDKLTAIEADKSFQGIWSYLHVHNYKYTGPTWERELANAKLVLAR